MSELNRLIDELCPDGVENKNLGDICIISNGKDHKHLEDGKYPVYGSGGIMRYADKYLYDIPSVLIPRKGSIGNLFFVDSPFWTVDTIFYTKINTKIIVPKYLYYYLSICKIKDMNTAGGVPSLTKTVLDKIRIIIPPLPIQEEIVRILDAFTTLEAELEAELEARKNQYVYYRDELLSFDHSVPVRKLHTLSEIGTGSSNTNEELEVGGFPFFVRSQEVRRMNTFEFDETAIVTSGDGVGVGKIIHFVEGKYALHQRAYRIHITDNTVLPKYFYYYMRCVFLPYIQQAAVNSSVTSIRRRMLEEFPVPIPPLAEQARIVEILDRFDALTNDITLGLPAEIAARRKQYEYYRDKLLLFKEKVT